MQIKITVRSYYIPMRAVKIWKIVTIPNTGEDVQKINLPYIADGNVNDVASLENSLAIS